MTSQIERAHETGRVEPPVCDCARKRNEWLRRLGARLTMGVRRLRDGATRVTPRVAAENHEVFCLFCPFCGADMRTEEDIRDALLDSPVRELRLSVRGRKCLARLGLRTVRDLVRRHPEELLACDNVGVVTVRQIRQALWDRGLSLRDDPPPDEHRLTRDAAGEGRPD